MSLSKHMPPSHEVEDLRVFVESAPVAMAMLDRDLRYICASRRWRLATGHPDEPIVGKLHGEVFPNVPQKWYDIYARCLQGEVAGSEREELVRDGRPYYVRWEARPWRDARGAIGGLMLFSENITLQVLAEERERQSATLLRTFYNSAPFMMGVVELLPDDIRYIDINAATVRFLGMESPEAMVGHTAIELGVNPRALQIWIQRLRQANAEGIVHFEYERTSAAGFRTLSVILTPVPSVDPGFPRFCYVIRDITEENKAVSALAISQERLAFALDATDEGVWDWDLTTGRLQPSSRLAQLLGFSLEEMEETLEFADTLVHPEDLDKVKRALADHIEGRASSFDTEFRMYRKDGRILWLHGRGRIVKRAADGKALRIVGTSRDITRRKEQEEALHRAAQALAESEERLAFALDATNEGVWDWDLKRGKLYASAHAAEQLGMRAEDLGDTFDFWQGRMHPEEVPQILRIVADYLEGRSPILAAEVRFRHQNGQYIWTELRGKIVKCSPDGRPLRLVGTHLDITRRKAQEEELHRAKEAAQAASEAKSAFLANISHEIRTPLSAILGSAEILEEGDLSKEKRIHFLEVVRRSGKHLMTLINRILDFSKIEAGKTEVERIHCDVSQLVGEVALFVRQRAASKSIRFTTECPPRIDMFTDPTCLRQILSNLLDNAVKFTGPGGHIGLQVRQEFSGSPKVHFEVRDTGLGISADQRARLFEPFVQADSSTTRRFGGTGLGLAISRRLARILGGDIELESTPGVGSRFTLWLPLDISRVGTGSPPLAAPPPQARPPLKARILLVEDGEDIQMLLAHVLERAGATLTLAADGAQGLAEAEAARRAGRDYDLIVMDIQMPGMDGNAAAAEMRRQGVKTPIIALTAAGMDKNRQQALAAGFDDFLVKPIDTDRLLEVLHIWTTQRSGAYEV